MDFDILIPIGICIVLPVTIVWLIMRTSQNETNRKAEIMLKAIEAGATIDPNLFKVEKNEPKSTKERLLKYLIAACVTMFPGLVLFAIALFSCIKLGFVFPDTLILTAGGILIAIGTAYLIVYRTGMKLLAKEIEAEEKSLTKE